MTHRAQSTMRDYGHTPSDHEQVLIEELGQLDEHRKDILHRLEAMK